MIASLFCVAYSFQIIKYYFSVYSLFKLWISIELNFSFLVRWQQKKSQCFAINWWNFVWMENENNVSLSLHGWKCELAEPIYTVQISSKFYLHKYYVIWFKFTCFKIACIALSPGLSVRDSIWLFFCFSSFFWPVVHFLFHRINGMYQCLDL